MPKADATELYRADAYRASDDNPALIDLDRGDRGCHSASLPIVMTYGSGADQVDNKIQQPLTNILDSPESINEAGSILAESEAEQTNLSGQDVIETNDGSTLIRIARQIRPDETVTLQQTMIAIQSLNPEE